MPTTISIQPNSNSINAAYRPIILKAALDNIMPIVFCDIYFNSIFYKTISTTVPSLVAEFDIQDATQEYLTKFLGINGSDIIQNASPAFVNCFCKIRGSSINPEGFTIIDPVIPIQGTLNTVPVSGTGLQSNTFFVINCTLQHEDNQDLPIHLNSFKTGNWSSLVWPLTHRNKNYKVASSDYYPIFSNHNKEIKCIKLYYKNKNGTQGSIDNCGIYPSCPILTGININSVDNLNNTQTYTISWNIPDILLNQVQIQYRLSGDINWIIGNTVPANQLYIIITLPLGLHDFRIKTSGNCTDTLGDPILDQGIEASGCVVPSIVGNPDLPPGVAYLPYSYSFNILGSPTFNIINTVKPGWLAINIVGNSVNFSGTPSIGDIGNGIPISFTIDNACGNVNFADIINVSTAGRFLDIFYSTGRWEAYLDQAISETLSLGYLTAAGTDEITCINYGEIDTLSPNLILPFGDTYVTRLTNGLTCNSIKYLIRNRIEINGTLYRNGSIFVAGGQSIMVRINNTLCSNYNC